MSFESGRPISGSNSVDYRAASLTRLDPVQFRLGFRNLPQISERQRSLDPLAQIAAIESDPSPQQFGAILFHKIRLKQSRDLRPEPDQLKFRRGRRRFSIGQ